jgi:hypothetical protein
MRGNTRPAKPTVQTHRDNIVAHSLTSKLCYHNRATMPFHNRFKPGIKLGRDADRAGQQRARALTVRGIIY